jgi:peroxiredoxin
LNDAEVEASVVNVPLKIRLKSSTRIHRMRNIRCIFTRKNLSKTIMNKTNTESKQNGNTQILKIAIVVGVVVLFMLGSYLLKEEALAEGDDAPVWNLPLANEGEGMLSLSSFRGKIALVDFWSTTCPPCLSQITVLLRIQHQFPELAVVGVEVGGESLDRLRDFTKLRNILYPVVSDTRGIAAKAYSVSSLPTLFIIGPDGTILASHEGFWPEEQLTAQIRKVMKK